MACGLLMIMAIIFYAHQSSLSSVAISSLEVMHPESNEAFKPLLNNFISEYGSATIASCAPCLFLTPRDGGVGTVVAHPFSHVKPSVVEWRNCTIKFLNETLGIQYKIKSRFVVFAGADFNIPTDRIGGFPTFVYTRPKRNQLVHTIPWPQEHVICESIFGSIDPHIKSIKTLYHKIMWHEKINKVVWRGGPWMPKFQETNLHLINFPRYHVSIMSYSDKETWLDACISYPRRERYPMKELHDRHALCSHRNMTALHEVEMMKYKYILNIGGASGTSNSILWKLATSSVVFHVESEYEDWYQSGTEPLLPWTHYVPIHMNLSNLYEQFLYMSSNDVLCTHIVRHANKWAESMNRQAKKRNYMIDLLLEKKLIALV